MTSKTDVIQMDVCYLVRRVKKESKEVGRC